LCQQKRRSFLTYTRTHLTSPDDDDEEEEEKEEKEQEK